MCVDVWMTGQLPGQYAAAVNRGWLPNGGSEDPHAMLGHGLHSVNDTLQELALQTPRG